MDRMKGPMVGTWTGFHEPDDEHMEIHFEDLVVIDDKRAIVVDGMLEIDFRTKGIHLFFCKARSQHSEKLGA